MKVKKVNTLEENYFTTNEYKLIQKGKELEIRRYGRKQLCHIKNISKDEYAIIDPYTKEILSRHKKEKASNRSESCRSMKRTFQELENIIKTNVIDNEKCLWLTLTYNQEKGIMDDIKKLYKDFDKFIKRLRYYLNKEKKIESIEYINIVEPQASGAWHMHLIILFEKKRPFIKNSIIANLWGNGFTKTKSLSNTDNLACYLCSYLSSYKTSNKHKILKNARLYMYPLNTRLYRISKGIKKPIIRNIKKKEYTNIIKKYIKKNEYNYKVYNDDNKLKQVIKKEYFINDV